jgi:ABC-type arginine/histidine transport system permease subunit
MLTFVYIFTKSFAALFRLFIGPDGRRALVRHDECAGHALRGDVAGAIGNEFVTMVKETSIIQYLGIGDLMYNNGIVVTSTYNPLPCYYISAIIYLALNIILGKGLNIFEGRLRKSER